MRFSIEISKIITKKLWISASFWRNGFLRILKRDFHFIIFFLRWKIGKTVTDNFPKLKIFLVAFPGYHVQSGHWKIIFFLVIFCFSKFGKLSLSFLQNPLTKFMWFMKPLRYQSKTCFSSRAFRAKFFFTYF